MGEDVFEILGKLGGLQKIVGVEGTVQLGSKEADRASPGILGIWVRLAEVLAIFQFLR
jgi:hypothetical protein